MLTNPYLPEFTPVRELSRDLLVTDEFRTEFNAWLVEIFGRKRTAYMVSGNLHMHPNTLRAYELQIMERSNGNYTN